MGGALAVDTALEHPDLVSAVVVSGAGTSEPYFTDPWTTRAMATWHAGMAAGDLDASVEGFMLFAAGPHRSLGELDAEVVSRLRRMAMETMSKHGAERARPPRPGARHLGTRPHHRRPRAGRQRRRRLPDHIGMAERLAGAVADGRATSIDGAAHYPNMERPDAFNRILGDFLRTV
ncbi:alpha/beta fold hydrolase [Nonomuraea ferruginea]